MSVSAIFTAIVNRAKAHTKTASYSIYDEWGVDITGDEYRRGVIELEPDPDGYTAEEDYQGEHCDLVRHTFRVRVSRSSKSRRIATGLVQDMIDAFQTAMHSTNDNLEQRYVLKGMMRFQPVRILTRSDTEQDADWNTVTGILKFSVKEFQNPSDR